VVYRTAARLPSPGVPPRRVRHGEPAGTGLGDNNSYCAGSALYETWHTVDTHT
jgi:hypothetical protein